jgi:hypothetical protein
MTPDTALAFSREVVDAIRRAQAPLVARVKELEGALAMQQSENASQLASVKALAETVRCDLTAAVDERIAAAVSKAVAEIPTIAGPPGESLRYRGVFDAGEAYGVGDWVTHDGTIWAALATSQGPAPGTDEGATSWRMAMKRPRDGVNGLGINWRGAFATGELYRLNDVVRDGGRLFICRKSTSTPPPIPGGAPAAEWALMLEG